MTHELARIVACALGRANVCAGHGGGGGERAHGAEARLRRLLAGDEGGQKSDGGADEADDADGTISVSR